MNIQYKTCTKCGEKKSLSEFHKAKGGKFGVRSVCKNCLYSEKYKLKLLIKKGFKLCCKCNIEKPLSEFGKNSNISDGFHSSCKICQLATSRKYNEINKTQVDKYCKTPEYKFKKHSWYLKNKEKIKRTNYNRRFKRNKLLRNRRIIDINFRIEGNLRGRICCAIKNNQKAGHTIELLGCSVEFLKKHLESQFKDGMSWDNYGRGLGNKGMQEWHIDHIIPCVKFDLIDPKQQEKCFNYNNLRPLWAKENLSRPKR